MSDFEHKQHRNHSITERHEGETAAEFLTRLKGQGFLFHGSHNSLIEELEPRSTFDPLSKENTDNAVFATDNPTWSAILGVCDRHIILSTAVYGDDVVAIIPSATREEVEKSKGVVYVLPRDGFVESGMTGQYKNKSAVKPVEKVEVALSDYQVLGGKVEWV